MRICLNIFLGIPWLSESHWSRLHVGFVTAKFSEWIKTVVPPPFCSFWQFDNDAFIYEFGSVLYSPALRSGCVLAAL